MLIVLFYKFIYIFFFFFTVQSITEKPLLSVKWNLLNRKKDTEMFELFTFFVMKSILFLCSCCCYCFADCSFAN